MLFVLTFLPSLLAAQLSFSDGSRLRSSEYLEHHVKDVSDEDLFASIRLTLPGMEAVAEAVEGQEYVKAYHAWGAYWGAKRQPHYLAQSYRLLIDTERLMRYGEVRTYSAQHPDEKDTVLARADAIMMNRFRVWGDVELQFGLRVDFNRDVGQSGKYGFHYWGWARPLNTAYVLTGDEKYLAKFDELFHQWYEQRNTVTRGFPELDVVYYELGLGVRNRTFIEYYLLPFTKRSWQTHACMLKTILGAARWLYELERWEGYRSGNWQIHGSFMLAQIAMAFPEFVESPQWLKVSLQRLDEHLKQDFFEDGGHSERSPRNYTLATYLTYRNLYYLLTVCKVREDLRQRIRQRMGTTIDWWITMLAPTGEIPAINDSHRGLFPTFVLQDGAEFFRKPYVNRVLKNLFGVSIGKGDFGLPSFTSRHMPQSGFTVMRTDWTRDALYMNLNYGTWNGPHTHNDMLDFEIYAYGKALAVDAGLGLTYDDSLYIPWYKSSRAHNMVVVNDQNMDRETVEGQDIVWSSSGSLEYFAGEHNGYAKLGAHDRRQIVFVKQKYWVVVDRLSCKQGGNTLSWYLHSPSTLAANGRGFQSSGAPGILVLPAEEGLKSRVGTCTAASTDDLTPGKTQMIHWVAFDQPTSEGSFKQFAILLCPYRDSSRNVEFTSLGTSHFLVKGSTFADHLYFSAGNLDDCTVSTDARFLLLHQEGGQSPRFALVDGTFLKINGRPVWRSARRTSAEDRLTNE
jgi:hypothetical protein